MDRKLKVGLVTARFNREITERLEDGALKALLEKGLAADQIIQVRVPGAVEIPLACQYLFESGCAAIVATGAVIRGDTTHYEMVCQSVERGVTDLMLRFGRPIGFAVLTTENEEQAMARAGGEHGNKGAEAAEVALEMLELQARLRAEQGVGI